MQHRNNTEEDHGEAYAASFAKPSDLPKPPVSVLDHYTSFDSCVCKCVTICWYQL